MCVHVFVCVFGGVCKIISFSLFGSFPAVVPGQLSIGNLKFNKNKIHDIMFIITAGLSKRGKRQQQTNILHTIGARTNKHR